MKISILLIGIVLLCGCIMTATNQKGETVILDGFGSGEVEFPDGTKIKKGLIDFPDLNLRN